MISFRLDPAFLLCDHAPLLSGALLLVVALVALRPEPIGCEGVVSEPIRENPCCRVLRIATPRARAQVRGGPRPCPGDLTSQLKLGGVWVLPGHSFLRLSAWKPDPPRSREPRYHRRGATSCIDSRRKRSCPNLQIAGERAVRLVRRIRPTPGPGCDIDRCDDARATSLSSSAYTQHSSWLPESTGFGIHIGWPRCRCTSKGRSDETQTSRTQWA